MVPDERPLLIIVGGAPGTGKSTLAQQISRALAVPVLSKDMFRETLADATGLRTREEVRAQSALLFPVFYGIVGRLLRAGSSVIAECNFRRDVSEPELMPLVEGSRAVLIHCKTSKEESLRRHAARFERGERHWCHFDAEWLADERAGAHAQDAGAYEPLALEIPTLRVDTTLGYRPDVDEIFAFIRSATGCST